MKVVTCFPSNCVRRKVFVGLFALIVCPRMRVRAATCSASAAILASAILSSSAAGATMGNTGATTGIGTGAGLTMVGAGDVALGVAAPEGGVVYPGVGATESVPVSIWGLGVSGLLNILDGVARAVATCLSKLWVSGGATVSGCVLDSPRLGGVLVMSWMLR